MENCRRNNTSCTDSMLLLNVCIFALCVVTYGVNLVIPVGGNEFSTCYLNDLLAMPLLLSYSQILCIRNGKKIKVLYMILLFIVCSVIWEGVMPAIWIRSVQDYMDVVQYFLGTVVYITIHLIGGNYVSNKSNDI